MAAMYDYSIKSSESSSVLKLFNLQENVKSVSMCLLPLAMFYVFISISCFRFDCWVLDFVFFLAKYLKRQHQPQIETADSLQYSSA